MSNKIDERVVSMQFDNSNFEKNVKTSMVTLDSLKDSLKNLGSTKSLENAQAAAKDLSNIDLSNIASGVATLERRFSTFGIVGMTVVSNLTTKLMSLFSRMTSFATNGVVSGGIKRAMNLENANFQLKGLLKSEKKVAAVMKNVNDAVDGTAYSLDEAAKVASQFAASGISAGKNMQKALRGVAGTAAMTNSEFGEIGNIFATVAGNGRLYAQQLQQLSSRGLNAAATLADYFNQSEKLQTKYYETYTAYKKKTDEAIVKGSKANEKAIRTMVTNGAIDFNTFAKAMDWAFGEHAKDANNTFQGSLSNIKSALGRIGADFVSPMIKSKGPMVKFLNTVRVKINELRAAIQPVVTMAASMTNTLVNRLNATVGKMDFTKLGKRLSVFNGRWDQLKDKLSATGVSTKTFAEAMNKACLKYGINLEELIKKEGSLSAIVNKGLLPRKVYVKAINMLNNKMSKGSSVITGNVKSLKEYKKVINDVIKGQYGNGTERIKKLTKAGYNYNQVQKLVNKTLSGSKISAKDYKKLLKGNSSYTQAQVKAMQKLADEANATGEDMNRFFRTLDKKNARTNYIESVKNSFKAIKRIIKSVRDAFNSIFSGRTASDAVKLSAAVREFTEGLIISKDTADKLKRTFAGLFAAIDIVRTILIRVLTAVFPKLGSVLGVTGRGVLSFTALIGDAIVKFRDLVIDGTASKKILGKLKTVFGQAGVKVKTFAKNHLTLEAMRKRLSQIKEKAVNVYDILAGKFAEIPTVLDQVKTSIKGLYDRMMAYPKVAAAMNKIKSVFKTVFEYIKKGFAELRERFKVFIAHVQELDGLSLDNIKAALVMFKEDVLNNFKDITAIAEKFPENLMSGFSNGFGDKFEAAKTKVIEFFKKLIETVKNVLGIHSPSTVFHEIGVNLMEGLEGGLLDASSGVFDAIGRIIGNLIDEFSRVSFGQLATIGVIIGEFTLLNRAIKMIELLAKKTDNIAKFNPFGGLNSLFATINANINMVAKTFDSKLKAETVAIKVNNFTKLVQSFAIFAAALTLLAHSDTKNLLIAGGVMFVLMGLMTGVYYAVSKMDLKDKDLGQATSIILSLVGLLMAIAIAVKILASIDWGTVGAAPIIVLVGTVLMLAALVWACTKLEKDVPNFAGINLTFLAMSVALISAARAIKILAGIPAAQLAKAAVTLVTLGAIFVAFTWVSKAAKSAALKAGGGFVLFAIAVKILMGAIKEIVSIPKAKLEQTRGVLRTLGWIFVEFTAVSFLAGANAARAGVMFAGFGLAVLSLMKALKMLIQMRPSQLNKGLLFIQGVTQLLMGLMIISMFAGEAAAGAGQMFKGFAFAIAAIAAAVWLIGGMRRTDIDKAIAAITALGYMCAAMVIVSSMAGEYSSQAGTMLLKMSAAMLIMVGAIALLTLLKPSDIVRATFCLSLVMAAFALLIASTKDMTRANKTIYALAVAIAVIAGAVFLLGSLDPARAILGEVCIVILIRALSTLVKSSSDISKSWLTVLTMSAVIIVLVGALMLLQNIPGQQLITSATAMGILLVTLAESLKILDSIVIDWKSTGLALAGIAALLLVIGLICGLLIKLDLMPSVAQATAIGILAITLALALDALTVAGAAGVGALIGVGVLLAAVTAIITFAALLGKVAEKHENLEYFVNKGLGMLKLIGYGIGEFFGSAIAGFKNSASLPKLGSNLSAFMDSIAPFLNSMKGINKDVASGAKMVASAVLELTAANFVDNINGALFQGSSIENFTNGVEALGAGLVSFIDATKSIDASQIEQVKNVAKAAKALTAIEPPNQEWYSRSKNTYLKNFSSQLGGLADDLITFADKTKEFDKTKNFNAAIKAINTLTEIEPPNQGIWATNDDSYLKNFSSQLGTLAGGLTSFVNQLPEKIPKKKILSAAEGLNALAEIEPIGSGFLSFLQDKNSLANFGDNLSTLGEGFAAFMGNIAGTTDFDPVKKAASALIELSKIDPPDDGFFWEKASLSKFGTSLGDLGSGMNSFMTELSAFNVEDITGVINSLVSISTIDFDTLADSVANMAKTGSKMDTVGLNLMMQNLNNICDLARTASGIDFSGINKLTKAYSKITSLSTDNIKKGDIDKSISTLSDQVSSSAKDKGADLKKTGKGLFSNLLSGFKSVKDTELSGVGSDSVDKIADGIKDKYEDVKEAGSGASKKILEGAKGEYVSFTLGGNYLSSGLTAGMISPASLAKAYNAGVELAKEAERGEKEYSDSHSPSRLFMKLGGYLSEGLAIGMTDKAKSVYNASSSVAESAEKGMTSAISMLSSMIEDGVDTEPVIKPVLDLSEVRSGASSINGMFEANKLTMSNVGSASLLMNVNQNSRSNDIVSAIKELGASLSGGDTYNINGVTYDDGSAINDAVGTLVRAARIERRI